MFLKLQREEWQELKLELLITLALKYGMTDLTIQNVIFGHLAALFIKWPL